MSFFDAKKGSKRKAQPKGARLGYDATGTKKLLKTASHNLYLLLERKNLTLNSGDRDLLKAIIRKAKKLLGE